MKFKFVMYHLELKMIEDRSKHVLQTQSCCSFLRIVVSLLLSRLFGNIIHNITDMYEGRISIAVLHKFEKVAVKSRKAELDLNFLKNCQSFHVFPKFSCFHCPTPASTMSLQLGNAC